MKKAYVATVQILIDPETSGVTDESSAADWVSGLLSENPQVKDWAYLPQHFSTSNLHIHPQEIHIPENYNEGDFAVIAKEKLRQRLT